MRKKISDAERQEAGRAFLEIWTRFFPTPAWRRPRYPHAVSHYTTAQGLLGICRSNALWATCAQYSNDSSEAMYGADLAKPLFRTFEQPERSVLGISLSLATGKRPFDPQNAREYGSLDAFTVSFCKSRDLLSQWRGYGARLGFEIRFSGMTVDTSRSKGRVVSLRSDSMLTGTWARIEYNPKVQQDMISEIMSGIANVRRELQAEPHFDSVHQPLLLHLALIEIARWVHSIKHRKFEEEQEWRVIAFQNSAPYAALTEKAAGMEFREGQHGVVPYLELRPATGRLPITGVVCGPGAHETLTPKAVELLLARYGHSNASVTTSDVPLRRP